MTRTLPDARDAFITAMNRDTAGSDRPRYTVVLDALVAWSLARPTQLTFRTEPSASGALSFDLAGTNTVFWSARPRRGDAPRIEFLPKAGKHLTAERRAAALDALKNCSRNSSEDDHRLEITFGALKNETVRETVFSIMHDLLPTA